MSLPILYGMLAAVIWGGQPVVSKFGYMALLSAWDLTFLRYLVSGTLMLPFVLRKGIFDACGLGWRRAIVLIMIAGPMYSLVLIGGVKWAPASHGALIYPALTPIFSVLLAKVFFKQAERFSSLGATLLVGGIFFIGIENVLYSTAGAAPNTWIGDLLFVLAAFMWALYIGLMRKWKTEPLAVMSMIQVGGLLYLPIYLVFSGFAVFQAPMSAILLQASYQGIVVSILSVTLINLAVQSLGVKASIFTALSPLVGVALSVAMLGEKASIWVVFGTLAIVSGLTISLRRRIIDADT